MRPPKYGPVSTSISEACARHCVAWAETVREVREMSESYDSACHWPQLTSLGGHNDALAGHVCRRRSRSSTLDLVLLVKVGTRSTRTA